MTRNRGGPHAFGPHGHVGRKTTLVIKKRQRQGDIAKSGQIWGRFDKRHVPRKGGQPSQNPWMQDLGGTVEAQRKGIAGRIRASRRGKSPWGSQYIGGYRYAFNQMHPRSPKGSLLAGHFRRK